MATECIAEFDMYGRQFMVLWKPSATYLRADGHMWGDSLGADLTQEAAIEQAKMRAEMMLINEREQEEKLVHGLFQKPVAAHFASCANDYICFRVALPSVTGGSDAGTGDAVYAPFNQNTYVCTPAGWRYVGSFPTQDEAVAGITSWCETNQVRPSISKATPFWQSGRTKWLGIALVAAFIVFVFWR
jgi:hypothetical protein